MTCYLKNLTSVIKKAGINKLTKDQRKAVDSTVRSLTGAQGSCPEVWPVVKDWLAEPSHEELLVKEIKDKLVLPPCP